jgi:hypothetical protein
MLFFPLLYLCPKEQVFGLLWELLLKKFRTACVFFVATFALWKVATFRLGCLRFGLLFWFGV